MGTPLTGGVSVRLTWSQSSVGMVDSYVIFYTRRQGCSMAPSGNATYTGSDTKFTLTGLQEAIGYEISVAAVNNGLLSERSDSAAITTLATGEC